METQLHHWTRGPMVRLTHNSATARSHRLFWALVILLILFLMGTPFSRNSSPQKFSFTAGTLVLTDSGYREIQALYPGDRLPGWDRIAGKLVYNTVDEVLSHRSDLVYQIAFEDGGYVEATWNHGFYIERGRVLVRDLSIGDRSRTMAELTEGDSPVAINDITASPRSQTVYTIRMAEGANYFVSRSDFLVGAD